MAIPLRCRGGNAVHLDLLNAFRALVPHLALLTEQREAFNKTLFSLEEEDGNNDTDNVYKRIGVTSVTISNGDVILFGHRITDNGVVRLVSPKVNLNKSPYEYNNSLSLAVDGLKYEAKMYIQEKKWRYIQTTLEFAEDNTKTDEDDPFKGVQPDEVPRVSVEFASNLPLVKENKPKNCRKAKVVKIS